MFTVEAFQSSFTINQGNNNFTIFGSLLWTYNRIITVVDTSLNHTAALYLEDKVATSLEPVRIDLAEPKNIFSGKFRHNIPSSDFLVLLTSKPNENNWFSSTNFDDGTRDIFVHTADWENYTECSSESVIAFQVVENILQALMFEGNDDESKYFHDPAIGCINDMCSWKPDITFKLRTADICADCLDKISSQGIEEDLVRQSIELFEHLRKRMLFNRKLQRETDYDPSLPFTIANTKRKLRTTFEPLRKFLLLLDHFDSIVRTSVIIFGKICLKDDFDQFAKDAGLHGKPSLGHWVGALQSVAKAASTIDKDSFPLPNDFCERLEGIVAKANEGKIVNLRNEYRGHGYCSIHDEKYKNVFESALPSLQYIEQVLLPLLVGLKVCYVTSFSIKKTGKKIRVKSLMGNHPDFEDKEIAFKTDDCLPFENQVYATKDGNWYDLHPYILYENCPECCHPRVLIYDGEQYLDPFVGHRVTITACQP